MSPVTLSQAARSLHRLSPTHEHKGADERGTTRTDETNEYEGKSSTEFKVIDGKIVDHVSKSQIMYVSQCS